MNDIELKEKIEKRIDRFIDGHIESMREDIAEITSRMNNLSSAVSFVSYLIVLKERIYTEVLKND
ncbi:hypothetical protein J6O86_09450 [bacterium]|nr:hypothetical protein [bacterium]